MTGEWYQPDLAYIHDAGFQDYALQATQGVLQILQQEKISEGLVVDVGCGSGISTLLLSEAGYEVLGIDISAAMIALARKKVPTAQFQVGSCFDVGIPTCHAVIAIGECLNYLFDPHLEEQSIPQLFQRIYQALSNGGIFLFDIAEPQDLPATSVQQGFREGEDWLVLVEKWQDPEQNLLYRRIITFRKAGDLYRRHEETHQQRLLQASILATQLNEVGFSVNVCPSYGSYPLPPNHSVLIARKLLSVI